VAFLESRKAAAALGATDEWNKMEGVAFNPEVPNVLYLAMSSISNAMTDAQGDIDLTENSCGIVYRMTMNTTWNVNRIDPAIVGGPYTSSAEYQCNIDNLAGPDNLLVLNDGRVLVGEDTWRHEHNTVWLWQQAISDTVGDESLTANVTVVSEDTSAGAFLHHAEMSDLRPGRTYTVNLLVSDADGETEGQINWRDITSGSKLSDYAFSLEPGCYLAVTSLYEQVDADHRAGNATVLVESMQSLTAGSGECVDGQYVAPDSNNGPLPGFGFPLTIIAVLGALVVLQRKPR
jgi:hypothetical protein